MYGVHVDYGYYWGRKDNAPVSTVYGGTDWAPFRLHNSGDNIRIVNHRRHIYSVVFSERTGIKLR